MVSHFATDPKFTDMRSTIAAKFGAEFLQLGKGSINQQSRAALPVSRMATRTSVDRC
jgi:hypothetical protein